MTARSCTLAATLVSVPLLMTSCSWLGLGVPAKCDKQTFTQVDSPSGTWKAATIRQICDYRNTKWSITMVEIRRGDQKDGTPVFTASNGSPQNMPNPADLKIEWKSDSELWILYPPGYHTTCTSTDAVGVAVHCADASIAR